MRTHAETKPQMIAAHGATTEQPAVMAAKPPNRPLHTSSTFQCPSRRRLPKSVVIAAIQPAWRRRRSTDVQFRELPEDVFVTKTWRRRRRSRRIISQRASMQEKQELGSSQELSWRQFVQRLSSFPGIQNKARECGRKSRDWIHTSRTRGGMYQARRAWHCDLGRSWHSHACQSDRYEDLRWALPRDLQCLPPCAPHHCPRNRWRRSWREDPRVLPSCLHSTTHLTTRANATLWDTRFLHNKNNNNRAEFYQNKKAATQNCNKSGWILSE